MGHAGSISRPSFARAVELRGGGRFPILERPGDDQGLFGYDCLQYTPCRSVSNLGIRKGIGSPLEKDAWILLLVLVRRRQAPTEAGLDLSVWHKVDHGECRPTHPFHRDRSQRRDWASVPILAVPTANGNGEKGFASVVGSTATGALFSSSAGIP